jgi:hypothetical protein
MCGSPPSPYVPKRSVEGEIATAKFAEFLFHELG